MEWVQPQRLCEYCTLYCIMYNRGTSRDSVNLNTVHLVKYCTVHMEYCMCMCMTIIENLSKVSCIKIWMLRGLYGGVSKKGIFLMFHLLTTHQIDQSNFQKFYIFIHQSDQVLIVKIIAWILWVGTIRENFESIN